MPESHRLLDQWREEAELFERRGQLSLAAMARSFVADLEAFERERAFEALTLKEAAAESGYSEAHLGRLVSEGKLRNAGEKGSPRIRRRDLGKKPRGNPHNGGPDLVGRVLGTSR
jgi:hypothetical protein